MREIVICLALMLAFTTGAHGQRSPPAAELDSVAARLIATAVIETVSHALARAVVETIPQQWTIEVPDSTSPPWRGLADGLTRMVLDPAPVHEEAIEHHAIRIRPYSIRGDTLVARFHFEEAYSCAHYGASLASHIIIYEVAAVRRNGEFLSPPTVRRIMTGHGRC